MCEKEHQKDGGVYPAGHLHTPKVEEKIFPGKDGEEDRDILEVTHISSGTIVEVREPMRFVRCDMPPGSGKYENYRVVAIQMQIVRLLAAPDDEDSRKALVYPRSERYSGLLRRGFQIITETVQFVPLINHAVYGLVPITLAELEITANDIFVEVAWPADEEEEQVRKLAESVRKIGGVPPGSITAPGES